MSRASGEQHRDHSWERLSWLFGLAFAREEKRQLRDCLDQTGPRVSVGLS